MLEATLRILYNTSREKDQKTVIDSKCSKMIIDYIKHLENDIKELEKEIKGLKTITQLYNSYEVPDDKHRMVIADTRFFEKGYFKKRFVEKEKILEIIKYASDSDSPTLHEIKELLEQKEASNDTDS